MTVIASFEAALKVDEVLALALDKAENPTIRHRLTEMKGSLSASTTPPATKAFSDSRALVAGADTLDLAALPGPLGSTIDLTGLKVQLVMIVAAVANTDRILVEVGATDGYALFGAATAEISLGPGEAAMFVYEDTLPDVGASAKEVDVSSADADAAYEILLVAG